MMLSKPPSDLVPEFSYLPQRSLSAHYDLGLMHLQRQPHSYCTCKTIPQYDKSVLQPVSDRVVAKCNDQLFEYYFLVCRDVR